MNKKLMLMLIAVILLVVIVFCISWLCNYIEFYENKKNVCDYLDSNYNIEYKLQYSKMGKNAWPAGRQEDEFIFYDLTNDIYFQIISGEDGLFDYYDEAYNGKFISQTIKDKFPSMQYLEYIIRCFGKYDIKDSLYEKMNCQIVFFTSNIEDNLGKIYEIIEYLKQNYKCIKTQIVIANPEKQKEYYDLFSYKKIQNINDMDPLYNLSVILDDKSFSSAEELRRFMEKTD